MVVPAALMLAVSFILTLAIRALALALADLGVAFVRIVAGLLPPRGVK